MTLGEEADIKWWYHFLVDECDLRLGKDWVWAWQNNCWAIDLHDPAQETWVRLKWPTL